MTIAMTDPAWTQTQGAERVYELTREMSPEEELAFWQERTEALLKKQEARRRAVGQRASRPEERHQAR